MINETSSSDILKFSVKTVSNLIKVRNLICCEYHLESISLQILQDRVNRHFARNSVIWNTFPGGLSVLPRYTRFHHTYPFFYQLDGTRPTKKFTAVIYATSPVLLSSAPLFRLIRTIAKSSYVHKVVIRTIAKSSYVHKVVIRSKIVCTMACAEFMKLCISID